MYLLIGGLDFTLAIGSIAPVTVKHLLFVGIEDFTENQT